MDNKTNLMEQKMLIESTKNGAGQYAFVLTVTDSPNADKYRIKIWNKDSKNVIYDNMPGVEEPSDATSLLCGSIVINDNKLKLSR